MELCGKKPEHYNLYYILRQDQAEHPMPEERAQEILKKILLRMAARPPD